MSVVVLHDVSTSVGFEWMFMFNVQSHKENNNLSWKGERAILIAFMV